MSETVIFAFVACLAVLLFNWAMFSGIRKARRTTRMFKINELYEKYEGVKEVPAKVSSTNSER